MTEHDRLTGQLETLELIYAELTERPLIAHQDGNHYTFDDKAEARELADAVATGTALTRFAASQLKQHTAR